MKPFSRSAEPISIAERFATAVISAIAAGITLLCYFLINFAFASKVPSGPPHWLFSLFASKLSLGIVALAGAAGFALGSARMAEVFSILWGTSELWQEVWFRKLMAAFTIVVLVLAIVYLSHASRA